MKSAARTSPSGPGEQVRSCSDLERLLRFAAGRKFVVSRVELVGLGFSSTQIRSWRVSGRLVDLFRAVYAFGRDIETRDAAWRAAILATHPGSALTGSSALEKWGAIRARSPMPRRIAVATPSDRVSVRRGLSPALRHTMVRSVKRDLDPRDLLRRDGLVLVRADMALIDYAVDATERDLRFAFLELCRLKLFQESDVARCLERAVGRRGSTKLKPLLGLWVPELTRTRSVFEGLFILAWRERNLVMPRVNERLHGFEVDLYWPENRLVVELDGNAFHSDEMARRRDLEKTRLLEGCGLKVLRVTWNEFSSDPESVIHRIARELAISVTEPR